MGNKKMSTEAAIKYYEDEAKKSEIRSMCDTDPIIKAGHKKRASHFKTMAETIRSLWGKKYHKATRLTETDKCETATKIINFSR